MIIRRSKKSELEKFVQIEQQAHASAFINQMSLADHQANFENQQIVYLSIVDSENNTAGFFILACEPEGTSIEFRRIVVDRDRIGIGQSAIREMEKYCVSELGASRIWLDVYADNEIGIHVYTKLGYRFDKESFVGGRCLRFYSKNLVS